MAAAVPNYELLVFAAIDGLEYERLDAACERYSIETDDVREPDAAASNCANTRGTRLKRSLLECWSNWRCCLPATRMNRFRRTIFW